MLSIYSFTSPYFKKYGRHPGIKAFVNCITAAVVGALAGSVIVIAIRTIRDIPTAFTALITIVILLRIKKVKEPNNFGCRSYRGLFKIADLIPIGFPFKNLPLPFHWLSNASYHPFYFLHLQYCLHTV